MGAEPVKADTMIARERSAREREKHDRKLEKGSEFISALDSQAPPESLSLCRLENNYFSRGGRSKSGFPEQVPHSTRSARIGSTLAARFAGITAARNAAAPSTAAMIAITTGSHGRTP